jgi:hypothetical protein
MKGRKWKLRSLMYFHTHEFEARTLQKHTMWNKGRPAAAAPCIADPREAGRKESAKHEVGGA